MAQYVYPASENAKGTNLRADLIKSNDDLEAHIFHKILGIVGQSHGLLVDIGAGEGRYSEFFGTQAQDIILVEPDERRLQTAQANVAENTQANIQPIQGTVKDIKLNDEQADVILNIHVLQHIHPDDADAILQNSARWLKKGGKLVLCFTQRTSKDKEFNASWKENGKGRYEPIPKEKFEQLTRMADPKVLPVHKMDKEAIKTRLEELGLNVVLQEDYTPRLIDLRRDALGRQIIKIYKHLSPVLVHTALKASGYKHFVDTCIVATK